jgi:NitT/TauT family transport system permease protein
VSAIYPLPKIALLPLIILWLGIGEESKLFVIALAVFFPIAINSMAGVRLTEPVLVKAAKNLGAGTLQVIGKVILPSAVPSILTGVRLGAGTSLLTLVAAEMIAAESGLGHLVLYAGDLMLTTKLMVGLVVLALLGIFVSRFMDYLERHFLRWRPQHAGEYL